MNIFFSVANKIIVKVSSDTAFTFTIKEQVLLEARIPGILLLESVPEHFDLLVEHHESADKKFIQENTKCTIFDTWNGILPEDLYHLLYGMVRVRLIQEHLYPVHAACIGNEAYVLILGHSGVGKSSVVLQLLKDKNAKLFSGDKTVISFSGQGLSAVAGTHTMTVRERDKTKLEQYIIENKIVSGDRYAFTLSEEKYATPQQVPIKAIVLMRLNDYVPELKREEKLSALHKLYSYFLDTVNTDTILNSVGEIFIGHPPVGSQKYLASYLKQALETMPLYSLTGPVEFIADEILKL